MPNPGLRRLLLPRAGRIQVITDQIAIGVGGVDPESFGSYPPRSLRVDHPSPSSSPSWLSPVPSPSKSLHSSLSSGSHPHHQGIHPSCQHPTHRRSSQYPYQLELRSIPQGRNHIVAPFRRTIRPRHRRGQRRLSHRDPSQNSLGIEWKGIPFIWEPISIIILIKTIACAIRICVLGGDGRQVALQL